jgi:hypothetical protein
MVDNSGMPPVSSAQPISAGDTEIPAGLSISRLWIVDAAQHTLGALLPPISSTLDTRHRLEALGLQFGIISPHITHED